MSVNRSKWSLAVDLKSDDGRRLVQRLTRDADIVVENFRPGVVAKLGLGFDELSADNPGLIYASISGYGQDSSESGKSGYDPIMQARSGLMSITGSAGGEPARVGVAVADISAGMWTAIGVLSALHHRDRTGQGQCLDVALLDAQVSWLTNVAGAWFATGAEASRYGTAHPSIVPSEAFATMDGLLMAAGGNDDMCARLAAVLGREELIADDRYATNAKRVEHRIELQAALRKIFATDVTANWLDRLDSAKVPAARVNTIGAALSDPLLDERDMIVSLDHPTAGAVRSLGVPVKLSASPVRSRSAPPLLGQHTRDILVELGLDSGQIDALIESGLVRSPDGAS